MVKKKVVKADYTGAIIVIEKREQPIINSETGKPLTKEDVVEFYKKGEMSLSHVSMLLNLSVQDAAEFLKQRGIKVKYTKGVRRSRHDS